MIDRSLSVRDLPTSRWRPRDVALNAVDDDGRRVWLVWSELTGELFTCLPGTGGTGILLDVLGRMDTFEDAHRLVRATRLPLLTGGGEISLATLRVQLGIGDG